MTVHGEAAATIGGVALLERAIGYSLCSLNAVTPGAMARPTPCRGWDLADLLDHMNDSLAALAEAVEGRIGPATPDMTDAAPPADPVARLKTRACHLLGGWSAAGHAGLVSIAGSALTAGLVTGTGALEITVHGWDVARACGLWHPIPDALADELLDLAPLLVTDADRPGRFAAPVEVAPGYGPGDRLLAFLGRRP